MVITKKRMYNYYLEDDKVAVARIRDKYKKRDNKKVNGSSKIKCILLIALVFCLGITLLYQHSRINKVNQEIIIIEKNLKEIKMINDSKEGSIISSLDLDAIEKIAKEELGMVEPSEDQYTYLVISDSSLQANQDENINANNSNNNENVVSWLARLID